MRPFHQSFRGLLLLVMAGRCDRDAYDVFVQPLDSGLRRTLECRRMDRDDQQRAVLETHNAGSAGPCGSALWWISTRE
jgi:surface antigen